MRALTLTAVLLAGCPAGGTVWPAAKQCGAQVISAAVLDAVAAIFGSGKPELDALRMTQLGVQHGAGLVKCAAVAIASLAGPPPGVSGASLPEHEAQVQARAQAWIDSTE